VLHRYGCDIIQGFFYSRPMPVAQLTTWLASGQAADPSSAVSNAPVT
jgi:EAL domain-containing protein (putative c-di-GMP-specific phosphodiesterase class I)